ncbi:universal stress protein [Marinobacter sp.]|uniref:universal stress protein n=1 Tax=Marinobacter sp. TaxID=50741 RepID=UPI003566CC12
MKKLLIVMDPEHKHQMALSRGIELARATGASLEVVAFAHEYLEAISDETETQEAARKAVTDQRQRWLEQVLALCACDDLEIESTTVWTKRIHEWLIRRCARAPVDAVIKTGNRSETFLYTPTDWHLIRECPAPVMLVAENKWNRARPILAAVDLGSDKPAKKALNHRIIAQARQLADALETDLQLVHALHTSVILADMDLVDTEARDRKRKAALKPQVEHLCHTWHLKPEHVHIVSGPAQKVIPSVANRIKADMVVIGTSGKTGLAAMVIGNTAEKVLTHLRTDLLAIKPSAD